MFSDIAENRFFNPLVGLCRFFQRRSGRPKQGRCFPVADPGGGRGTCPASGSELHVENFRINTIFPKKPCFYAEKGSHVAQKHTISLTTPSLTSVPPLGNSCIRRWCFLVLRRSFSSSFQNFKADQLLFLVEKWLIVFQPPDFSDGDKKSLRSRYRRQLQSTSVIYRNGPGLRDAEREGSLAQNEARNADSGKYSEHRIIGSEVEDPSWK